jgi:cytochrome c peroxidase
MLKIALRFPIVLAGTALVAASFPAAAKPPSPANGPSPAIGERPVLEEHVDQAAVEAGEFSWKQLSALGRAVFDARFNTLDGQGRPASTGTGAPRFPDQPAFVRTSAPESNSCAGCHAQPASGGAGDMVANVFVLAQALDPVTFSVHPSESNERNTLGMFGAGAVEMLAREMSAELIALREEAATAAADSGAAATRDLVAKGVDFGRISVLPDGRVDPSEIAGVDWDLIVKPFHQKGAVVSLREFTNNAMNHHHGMQSVERFGAGSDPDQDGVRDELTVGDITAATVFQAALPAPVQAHAKHPARRKAAKRGAVVFGAIGCDGCHVAELVLASRRFSEPNPFNPPGNLQPGEVVAPFEFDLVQSSASESVRPLPGGRAAVRAFTDLKRHDLNDADFDHFANEQLTQGTLAGFADPADFTIAPVPRPTGEFLTRKLWDVGNSDPYGHRGDLTTLTEAIHFHGGDARTERDEYFALPQADQDAVIEFLKSLVVEP